jgi:multiple sugar transport system ATP-binding protein
MNPQLLLIDDGLDVLPSVERQETRNLLRRVQRSLRLTTIYATNDFADAMPLADRIAFLSGGRFHQTDTPALLYENPASTAVAAALGSPTINLLEGRLESQTLSLSDQALAVDGLLPGAATGAARAVTVGIRPESFDVFGDRNNSILAILDPSSRESRGSYSIVRGLVGDSAVFVQIPGNPADFPRRAYAEPRRILLFDPASGERLV